MSPKKGIILNNLKELPSVAKKILYCLEKPCVVAIYGEMGAGKTTLIKALCDELDVIDTVTSPTFAIINEYQTKASEYIYHFDFYRIENTKELLDIGTEDYFYRDSYCFIEWPEVAVSLLPENTIQLTIKEIENGRRVIEISKTIE